MMSEPNEQQTNNHAYFAATILPLLKANAMLGITKSMLVYPTQPLQTLIRTIQATLASQTSPQFLTIREAVKLIYNSDPAKPSMKHFFKGAQAGAAKELLKNCVYKGALITGAPTLADRVLEAGGVQSALFSPWQYHFMQSGLAGPIASFGDVVLGGGLESWATFRATSHGAAANASFWREVGAAGGLRDKIARAYRGGWATGFKGTVAFTTFFAAGAPIRDQVVKLYGLPDAKSLPWHGHLTNAFLVGGLVALTSSPLDIVKTQAQMPNPSKLSIPQALMSNYAKYGMKGVTAGVWLKFAMITLGWGLTSLVIQPGHKKTATEATPASSSSSLFGFFSPEKPVRVQEAEEATAAAAPKPTA